jgi:hypothetical protein
VIEKISKTENGDLAQSSDHQVHLPAQHGIPEDGGSHQENAAHDRRRARQVTEALSHHNLERFHWFIILST